jgi:hypothetical protein
MWCFSSPLISILRATMPVQLSDTPTKDPKDTLPWAELAIIFRFPQF